MRHSPRFLHRLFLLMIVSSVGAGQKKDNKGVTTNAFASPNFAFEQITIADGLPYNTVRCILQDSQGFLWFGTADGLARYDGYHFKIYRHDLADSTTISNNKILVICEDRFQDLWIGTYNGLNRFDRSTETFTHYIQGPEESSGRRAHEVWAIHEDRAGNLWVGYWAGEYLPLGGLYKLDRQTGKFTAYRYDPYNPNSISHNAIRCIVEDDNGVLWVGTEAEGLNKFDPTTETFTRYRHDLNDPRSLGDNRVWDGLKDREGNLWFATISGGLNKYDPASDGFIHYVPNPNNANGPYLFDVCKVYQDSRGMIWFSNGVLSRFDPATSSFTHYRFSMHQNDWGSNYHPFAVQEDNAGNLWVGTRGSGVFKVDLKPQRFTHYRHAPENSNSLNDDDVRLVFEAAKGSIWIATRDHGLSRLEPQTGQFTNFKHDPHDPRSLSSDVVYALCEDRAGNIWVGTQKGLNRFDPEQQHFMRYERDAANLHNLSHNAINAVFVDRADTLWISMAGEGGFGPFDWRTKTWRRNDPLPINKGNYYVDRFFEDRRGNLWISAAGRQFLFDRRTGQSRITKVDWGGWGWGRHLLEDQNGTIWGWYRSLYKLNFSNLTFHDFFLLEPVGANTAGMIAFYNQVQFAYLDAKNKIWCGTLHGLYQFDPQLKQVTARYYAKDRLPSDLITKITADNAGRLWLLTGAGVSIFDENAPPGKQFTNLGPNDGVINTPSAPEAFIRTRSGEIYWGGANGVYRFYPEVQATNPRPPQIRLTDFRKFNKPVKLDSSISTIHALRLRHDENFFSLSFAAMDFTNPKQNQYAYKLESLDQDWIQAGNKHEADYTHVPPGKYTFRVKGANNDGVWNEVGASVQIIIAPPFWQTWWFRLAAALAVIALLTTLYNYRVSKLLEIERTRLRIARDLHDDVGSSLSSIALTAEMLQKEIAGDGVINRQLVRVHETAQKLNRNLKEIVWAIDPQRDKSGDLLLHMKETAEELLGQKGIAYTLDLPEEELPRSLKMEFRRNLFLIYKEMLHNIVKHAEASKVEITLTRMNGVLQLQVADNGRGFDEGENGNGSGLKSMRARAEELNGKLEIESRPEAGTRVRLEVKV